MSFDVADREFVHVCGDSGCGKSTLARCAVGLIPRLYKGRMEGEVLVQGRPTSEWPVQELTAAVGLVLQNPAHQMLSSTVENEIVLGLECLGLSRRDIAGRLEDTLRQFDLVPLRTRSTHQLSGGEQQRVALAAVAARQPKTLVLDEPLSMLCPSASLLLLGYLRTIVGRGTSVLALDHRVGYFNDLDSCRTIRLSGPGPAAPPANADFSDGSSGEGFVLRAEGLSASLAGRQVLRDIDFSADAGEAVAVLGANGAGKTTLLRCLAGLEPCEGTLSVSGARPLDLYCVAQNPDGQIFNATVAEELASVHGSRELRDWIVSAFGLESCLDRPSLLLSDGQKKRLILAVAVLREPTHGLLLDEPSLGQGASDKATLGSLIHSVARAGSVVLVATHDVEFVLDHIPRVVLLSDGQILADGPTLQVLADRAALARAGLTLPAFLRRRVGAQP